MALEEKKYFKYQLNDGKNKIVFKTGLQNVMGKMFS